MPAATLLYVNVVCGFEPVTYVAPLDSAIAPLVSADVLKIASLIFELPVLAATIVIVAVAEVVNLRHPFAAFPVSIQYGVELLTRHIAPVPLIVTLPRTESASIEVLSEVIPSA